jgi:hypothetical protein
MEWKQPSTAKIHPSDQIAPHVQSADPTSALFLPKSVSFPFRFSASISASALALHFGNSSFPVHRPKSAILVLRHEIPVLGSGTNLEIFSSENTGHLAYDNDTTMKTSFSRPLPIPTFSLSPKSCF